MRNDDEKKFSKMKYVILFDIELKEKSNEIVHLLAHYAFEKSFEYE